MTINIGIDTGGTFTDAVVYDTIEKRVLAKAKARTTKENLAFGIAEALGGLPKRYFVKRVFWSYRRRWLPTPVLRTRGRDPSSCS